MSKLFIKEEARAIGAIKLSDDCFTSEGTLYKDSFKGVISDKVSIDYIMKSIDTISKVPDGFKGTHSGYFGKGKPFYIDIKNRKVYILNKERGLTMSPNDRGDRLRININNNSINCARLIACANMLFEGYVVDNWNKTKVNHMDNSAGEYYKACGRSENITPDNLELYTESIFNNSHRDMWNLLKSKGILSKFSCYDMNFKEFIFSLGLIGQLDKKTIMTYSGTKVKPNLVVEFS